jgi:PAS domain S-box-containing protein
MDREKNSDELIFANKEIAFLNQEKQKRVKELKDAYKEIAFQIEERGSRATELAIANVELIFQNKEKERRAAELIIANKELVFQNKQKEKRAKELAVANNKLQKAEANVRKLNADLEQKVIRRSAQYAFISQVNQTIVHIKDAETLFRDVCHIALKFGKFKMAWIGSFNVIEKKITLLDHSGIPADDIGLFTDVPYESNGPQDAVLRTGKYFLSNYIEDELELENWKPYAAKNSIHSCIVLPIKKSGIIFGTFNIYAAEQNCFKKEDIKLLIEVAGDISFALDLFERTKKHSEIEEIIIKNEKRFRALIENSTDMKTLAKIDGSPLYASPSVSKVLGYTLEEFLNTTTVDLIHPDDISGFFENLQIMLGTAGSSFYSQHRMKHRMGNYIWCEGTITNMLHEPRVNAVVSNLRDISVKKLIEDQQKFAHNNLHAMINNINGLMWSVDKDFKLISSNKSFDDKVKLLSSHAVEIAIGRNVLDSGFPREHADRYKKYYERAFLGEAFTQVEFTKNPFENWSEISFNPIKNGEEIIGTACHSHNITDIKKSVKRIREREAFTLGILNSLNSHIAVINESGEIVAVNESWRTFARENGDTTLQHTAEGANYFSVCEKAAKSGEEIAKKVLTGMKAVMNEKQKYFYLEYPCHLPHKKRWFGMRAMKFISDVPMIVVAHLDISERKLAEKNLLKSEARLKEAQAIAHISNWEVDLVNKTTTCSDEFYNINEISRDEIKPSLEAFLAMLHPDDYKIARARMKKSFQTLEASAFSSRIKTASGRVRYIYTEWKFEFDKSKRPVRLYGILQDVTERKIAEEEREKLIKDMIQRNRDLEQFTFIISHNLRAPTANIIGFTEILQDETLTPKEKKEFLQGLSTSVLGLDTVIKDINYILQVKGEVNEKKELMSFSGLANNTLIGISNLIEKHHVRIKTDFSKVDKIFSLKIYLQSIFYNLISNSIKYSRPDEQPLIEIKSREENGKIILTFKDNGLGIDMKTKGSQLFGLYRRFHSHVEGKGMGLFMVKTQVEAIGGQISVRSEPNKGTQFTIVFEN